MRYRPFFQFLFAGVIFITATLPLQAQNIRYVKEGMSGSGASWADASGDLQAMINLPGVNQVWVAKGTYKPIYRADNMDGVDPDDPANAFVLKKDVQIYGGFAGTESSLAERDVNNAANKTILSGDLGVEEEESDNAFHVVISAGDVGDAELNGFVIQLGNGRRERTLMVNGLSIYEKSGAGLYIAGSSPVIKNVAVLSNQSIGNGAGIYMSNASAILINIQVSGNKAPAGAGIMIHQSTPHLINALISGNTAVHTQEEE